jgi:hypothetical protein
VSRRALVVAASLLMTSATCLHVSSCSDDTTITSADASPGDAPGGDTADTRPTDDGAAGDASADAVDASDAADACARCASGSCDQAGCDPAVFVTSKVYTGMIGDGGTAAADHECAALAAAAGLPGTFRAWLSAGGASAPASRFARSSRKYRLLDGRPVAGNFALLAMNLESTISFTETRVEVPFSYVWTATNGDGTRPPDGGDCAGWTSSDAGDVGGAGESDDTVSEWTSFGDVPCSTTARLYCFEQGP